MGCRWVARSTTAVCLLLADPVLRAGDQPAGTAPEQHDFQDEVTVRLVDIALLAIDRAGNPVTDLAPNELEVRARGRTLPIRACKSARRAGAAAGSVPVLLRWDDPAAASSQEVGATNLSEPGGGTPSPRLPGRAIVLLIDPGTLDPPRRALERSAVHEVIQRSLGANDVVALVAQSDRPEIEAPFGASRALLHAAVDRVFDAPLPPQPTERRRVEELIERMEDCRTPRMEIDERCFRSVATEHAAQHRPAAQRALDGLRAAVSLAGARTEPALVIAITHGAPVDTSPEALEVARALTGDAAIGKLTLLASPGDDLTAAREELISDAARRGVTVHVIDPSPQPAGTFSARYGRLAVGARPFEVAYAAPQADFRRVAAATGGTFRAQTELVSATSAVLAVDAARYRVTLDLGAEPLAREELRRLTWNCTRSGVRLIAGDASYRTAIVSEELVGGLRFGTPRPDGAGKAVLTFDLLVDPRGLGYRLDGTDWSAPLAAHAELLDTSGAPVGESFLFFTHRFDSAAWTGTPEPRLHLSGRVLTPPGAYRLVVSLRNVRSFEGGALARPLTLSAR